MKKLLNCMLAIMFVLTFVSCGNKDVLDVVYTYDTAIVKMHDGSTVIYEISSWRDYDDGDQIQITTKDGSIYLVHSINCVLVQSGTDPYYNYIDNGEV